MRGNVRNLPKLPTTPVAASFWHVTTSSLFVMAPRSSLCTYRLHSQWNPCRPWWAARYRRCSHCGVGEGTGDVGLSSTMTLDCIPARGEVSAGRRRMGIVSFIWKLLSLLVQVKVEREEGKDRVKKKTSFWNQGKKQAKSSGVYDLRKEAFDRSVSPAWGKVIHMPLLR